MNVPETWEVFLSHSSKDKPHARILRDELRDRGVTVWFDEDEIGAADSIPLKVEEGIENSETIVICLSPSFLGSEWTTAERAAFMYADPINRRPTLIPVLFEDCVIPRAIAHLRHVDLRQPSAAAVEQIVEAVRRPGQARLQGNPARGGLLPFVPSPPLERPELVAYIRGGLAIGLERCVGRQQVLLVVDLDGFNNINRMFGPEAGDRLVDVLDSAIADWCASELSDLLALSAAIVRGVDEWFVLLVGDEMDESYAEQAANRLSDAVRSLDFNEISRDLYASACVSYVIRQKTEPVLTLMRRGLTGLRAAKRIGSGSVSVGPQAVRRLSNEYEESIEVRQMTSPLESYLLVSMKKRGTWGESTSAMAYADDGTALLGVLHNGQMLMRNRNPTLLGNLSHLA